ncbi:hypothetical protein [Acrocarpospora sp. B8E8]|uniref:hypothetical protein n=1 Tax=Acrocarpospora sp. B8E8 TaxID=3153572 RepID=UPI00325E0FF0
MASYRAAGHQPWHLDAGRTAVAFAQDYLGFEQIDLAVSSVFQGEHARVRVGYPPPGPAAQRVGLLPGVVDRRLGLRYDLGSAVRGGGGPRGVGLGAGVRHESGRPLASILNQGVGGMFALDADLRAASGEVRQVGEDWIEFGLEFGAAVRGHADRTGRPWHTGRAEPPGEVAQPCHPEGLPTSTS